MNGFCWIFFAFQMFCRSLAIMLGVAIIFTGFFTASTIHDTHFAYSQAQLIAKSDHAIPTENKVQDRKADVTCGVGVCNFAYIVPPEEAFTVNPFSEAVERTDIAQLVTRIVAPPLPPPKIIILG